MNSCTRTINDILVPPALVVYQSGWPERHISHGGTPVPFHIGQNYAHDADTRIVAMLAGSQGGKTGYGPWWQWSEIMRTGGGDHLAVTASYDLFKLKMLPAIMEVYEDILKIGRYWAGDRVLEIADPATGRFYAKKNTDKMWGRIILRSADAPRGLESGTAKSAWLDEAGMPSFSIRVWRAIRRRLALSQGRILITSTLYDVTWIDTEIMDRAERDGIKTVENIGEAEIEKTRSENANITLIQYDSILNPQYPKEEYYEAQETQPADEFQMFYRGRRTTMRSRIYDTFDRKFDTCKRFPIPDNWRRFVGMDYGGINTVGLYFAEDPGSASPKTLYCYRVYHEGKRTAKIHVDEMLLDEPGKPYTVGGAASEQQWRDEFSQAGLPVRKPTISDVKLGIDVVYVQTKQHRIIYFDDLEDVITQKEHYRRKLGPDGNPTTEIENKAAQHYCDAERYIISEIRREGSKPPDPDEFAKVGHIENYQSRWS